MTDVVTARPRPAERMRSFALAAVPYVIAVLAAFAVVTVLILALGHDLNRRANHCECNKLAHQKDCPMPT